MGMLADDDARWLDEHFDAEIFPVLTPITVDPTHPFPHVTSKSLTIAALLSNDDPEHPERLAVVQAPSALARIVRLPARNGLRRYVFLADVIRWSLPKLFPGLPILDHTAVRVTRNSNLYVDEEEVENLLTAIEQELRRRRRGEAVRLEVRLPVGQRLEAALLDNFGLAVADLDECDGPVNLSRVMDLVALEDNERLRARSPRRHIPSCATDLLRCATARVLHHPSTPSRAWSISSRRPQKTRMCSRSSRRSTAPATIRRSRARWSPRPSTASR